MSKKPETTFIASVHRHTPSTLYAMKNNNPFTGGVADVWYSGASKDLWVEYKWLSKTPKAVFEPALSALQLKWLRERHGEGRNVAVIVGSPDGGIVLRDRQWEQECLFTPLLSRKELAQWITEETTCQLSELLQQQ